MPGCSFQTKRGTESINKGGSERVIVRVCACVCACACVCVCVRVCVAVWCSDVVVVSLAQGLMSLSSSPTQVIFYLIFICLPPAPPVHPAMIRYLAFAKVQIQGLFSWNSNGTGGALGAHTTCCEERPVLMRVPSPAPGVCLHGS